MGRHADTTRRRGFRVPIGVISIVLVLVCAAGLGIWWWSLKSATDPIDANPVDGYAVVLSSPACSLGGVTTVRISGTNPPVTATLDACGYRVGEQLPVQYLSGHPETVRLTGTSTAGAQSMAAKLLPIGILAAGVIAVLATIALLVDRRRSRHQVDPVRRGRSAPASVARQPATGAGGGGAGGAAAVGAGASVTSPAEIGSTPNGDDGGDAGAGADADARADADGDVAAVSDLSAVADVDAAIPTTVGRLASSAPTTHEPAGLFPEESFGTAFSAATPYAASPVTEEEAPADPAVVIDDGILFTHTNPEPPEPAGAPVELSANGPQHLPPTVAVPADDPD